MSFSPHPPSLSGSNSVEEQRSRWERKRSRAAKELVQTEQHYCQQLELVTTFFVEILKAKGTLKEDIREAIFSSIKSILSINRDEICLRLRMTSLPAMFSQIQLKKNKAFRRFKTLQEARPQFDNQKLEDLLQMPVQRIQQCPATDAVVSLFPVGAVDALSEVSQRIKDNAQRHDNHLQLCRVQKLLKGRKAQVLAPGRWFIREGWLNIVPPKGSETKPKMFFLFSDLLLEAKCCSPLSFSSGRKYVGQHAYPLRDAAIEKVFGHTRSSGGLLSEGKLRFFFIFLSTLFFSIAPHVYRSIYIVIELSPSPNSQLYSTYCRTNSPPYFLTASAVSRPTASS
uniref:Rho guanine nucleotide exchange factor (GEF) 39 n=1 Tax=Cyprinodon variegatus TaxID=28743 RepID=A0A3Q2DCU0_CYPVA